MQDNATVQHVTHSAIQYCSPTYNIQFNIPRLVDTKMIFFALPKRTFFLQQEEKHLYVFHGDAEVQQHEKLPSMTYSDSV